jgi:hypothetical protein
MKTLGFSVMVQHVRRPAHTQCRAAHHTRPGRSGCSFIYSWWLIDRNRTGILSTIGPRVWKPGTVAQSRLVEGRPVDQAPWFGPLAGWPSRSMFCVTFTPVTIPVLPGSHWRGFVNFGRAEEPHMSVSPHNAILLQAVERHSDRLLVDVRVVGVQDEAADFGSL